MFDITRQEPRPDISERFNKLTNALNKCRILSKKYATFFPEYFTVYTSTFVIDKQLYILDEIIGTIEPYANKTICLTFRSKDDIERLLTTQSLTISTKKELDNWFLPVELSYKNLDYYALRNNLTLPEEAVNSNTESN